MIIRAFLLFLLAFFGANFCFAQTVPSNSPSPTPTPSLEKQFLKNIVKDQAAIWTSPFHLKKKDTPWLIPIGAVSAVFFATDKKTAGALDDNNQSRLRISKNISYLGSGYAETGTAATFYLVGKITHNARAKETGLLAAEALIDNGIVVETLKFATQRPRPLEKERNGEFYDGGNSFPSGHSSSIWALAAVISDEYGKNHPFVKYGVYGLATAVSISRYTGQKHYLSDILIGGAIGYGIGHFVYLRHHDKNLDSPDNSKSTTKLEKYVPNIVAHYDPRHRVYGAKLAWSF